MEMHLRPQLIGEDLTEEPAAVTGWKTAFGDYLRGAFSDVFSNHQDAGFFRKSKRSWSRRPHAWSSVDPLLVDGFLEACRLGPNPGLSGILEQGTGFE